MATIYEVSKLAGVSLATVSRVMNKNAKVSDKTKAKVLDAMEALGYRPNNIARSLASNRTDSVGIMVSELHGPFFGDMMAGIEEELRAAGKHVVITTGGDTLEEDKEHGEKEGIDFLIDRNCDALIVHVESISDEYLINLHKGKTPVYLMSRYVKQMADNCISLNNEQGGYLAAKALIDKGHEKIAYISGPLFKPDSTARLNGHKRALSEHGIDFDERLLCTGEFKEIGGTKGLKHLIDTGVEFTAVACGNDEIASGVMKYAREHNMKLPEDLSVIGFDNVNFASYIYPTLTTIDNPVRRMGRMAAKLVLQDVYRQKQDDIKRIFEPKLIERHTILEKS